MKREAPAVAAAGYWLRMTNMIGSAGKQKTFERMIDSRIAVVGYGSPGRQIHLMDETAADIQNGALIQIQSRATPCRKCLHANAFTLSVSVLLRL